MTMSGGFFDKFATELREAGLRELGLEPAKDLQPAQRQCPQCAKVYRPELFDADKYGRGILLWQGGALVQEAFPNPECPTRETGPELEAWAAACQVMSTKREQLLSGICSDDCWKAYVGDPGDEEEDEGSEDEEPGT